MRNKSIIWLLFVGVVVCALMGIASLLSPAHALPPRPPTPTPTVQARSTSQDDDAGTEGAVSSIELHARFPAAWPWNEIHWQDLWTVVQWRDPQGEWNDVEGWRGTLDRVVTGDDARIAGRKTWWVIRSDLGRGPFRWVVYQGKRGKKLGESELFYLPDCDGEVTIVDLSLAQ